MKKPKSKKRKSRNRKKRNPVQNNPVAKYSEKFNRPATHEDKTKYKRKKKHKGVDPEG